MQDRRAAILVTGFSNQPTRLNEGDFVRHPDAVGVPGDFEAFEATTKYQGATHTGAQAPTFEVIEPAAKLPISPFPLQLTRLIESLWMRACVSEGQQRSDISIGQQRGPVNIDPTPYHYQPPLHPQVAPIQPAVNSHMKLLDKSAFPQDWKLMNDIRRMNAYTFRGDARGPALILQTGFEPSAMRDDDGFLKGNIYNYFKEYFKVRFQMELPAHVTPEYFLNMVREQFPTVEDREILVHYFYWRKLCEREQFHLGRMVAHECLKYYVSTTRSLKTAVQFATRYCTVNGWVYVTLVRGGLVVPLPGQHIIFQQEHEIAQLGPIGPNELVGFRHYDNDNITFDGPAYFRRSFRKNEPAAFLKTYKILCGKLQKGSET
jgi:hypothetical protein